ncbi:glycosyltransferase family 4 protein [Litorihabitans aurantiacus]|uniref:glycosyltransferase family 4 protein n=1 Tax=Litorihabitans aurantiacus TaxID=1930061 RepID=UPI0024E191AB|nr:glycosyltransferase family 4 protein [Litorihabitans aurantiacus]
MTRPVRALLVNENIGGHATVHHHLRAVAAERTDVAVDVRDVPPPDLLRRIAGLPLPGLAALDADLRAARYQLAQSAWVARALPGWLRRGYDVVHLYTHNTGLLARRALRGVPYVVTLDSTNAQSNLLHPVREPTRFSPLSTAATRPLERALYSGAARVVANSAWAAASLRADYGVESDRLVVQPMGVPLAATPESATAPTGPMGPMGPMGPTGQRVLPLTDLPVLVFVGRTMGRKGGRLVLEAHQRHLVDRCHLVLVTTDEVAPAGRPLREVTVLRDVRPGDGVVDRVLAGAAVLALPSAIDQWPNAVMEAMAHGVVPVVSDVGGMPEMVADPSTAHGAGRSVGPPAGIVLPERSVAAVARAVGDLLADPARLERLGHAARERVRRDLDVRLTAGALLDVLVDVAR